MKVVELAVVSPRLFWATLAKAIRVFVASPNQMKFPRSAIRIYRSPSTR